MFVEDEPHFLILCPFYASLKQKYCIVPTAGDANVMQHFVEIMTTSDTHCLCSLSNFLSEAFKVRDATIQ
jgi:hypothetical protein